MLDAPGQRQRALHSRRYALLHVHRGQTGIGEKADDDGLFEVGQNVDRDARNHRRAQKAQRNRAGEHHGRHGQESTRGVVPPDVSEHPILRGVDDVWGPTDVYGIRNLPPPGSS